jgi:hypothetical protein
MQPKLKYLNPLHPHIYAAGGGRPVAGSCRFYPDYAGLPARRLAARRVAGFGTALGVLFAFLCNIGGGSGLHEERLIPRACFH